MSLNDSLSELERSKLAVWDYPVSDKYTKVQRVLNDLQRTSRRCVSLNDSLSELERSKLAVWDYPVSDKYTKVQRVLNDL